MAGRVRMTVGTCIKDQALCLVFFLRFIAVVGHIREDLLDICRLDGMESPPEALAVSPKTLGWTVVNFVAVESPRVQQIGRAHV